MTSDLAGVHPEAGGGEGAGEASGAGAEETRGGAGGGETEAGERRLTETV